MREFFPSLSWDFLVKRSPRHSIPTFLNKMEFRVWNVHETAHCLMCTGVYRGRVYICTCVRPPSMKPKGNECMHDDERTNERWDSGQDSGTETGQGLLQRDIHSGRVGRV